MKKIASIGLILLTAMLSSFSMSKNNNYFSEEGVISSFGNEPFSFPGFVTENGKKYSIKADEKILKELIKNHGKVILLKGILQENEENMLSFNKLKDGTVIVKSYKILK